MKQKRILVTGAAGFIGSNLCERLLSEGHRVIGVDNLSSGSQSNIEHMLDYKQFEFIKHDITNEFFVEVDQIYNLASPSSKGFHINEPIDTIKSIIVGSINILNVAKRNHATFLQASTSKIYGNINSGPTSEQSVGMVNMHSDSAPYIESKRVAETLTSAYNRKYSTAIRIARIFNSYGPKMVNDGHRIIPIAIVNALQNKDFTIYDNGLQHRNYCYIDDTIEALMRLMNGDIHIEEDLNFGVSESSYGMIDMEQQGRQNIKRERLLKPMNIGRADSIAIHNIIDMIISLTGSRSKVTYTNLSNDKLGHSTPDISAAKDVLGWEPMVSLEVGLVKTIDYFEQGLSKQSKSPYPYISWIEMA